MRKISRLFLSTLVATDIGSGVNSVSIECEGGVGSDVDIGGSTLVVGEIIKF